MTKPSARKFDKDFHHYIPRCWLRHFAGANGQLWKRENGKIQRTSVAEVMGECWLYTTYDERFRPSDELEDKLSSIEGHASRLFKDLNSSNALPTDHQWVELCLWMALTACRHPKTMMRGHTRGKELAYELADVSSHSGEREFLDQLRNKFGADLPSGTRNALVRKGDEALLEEAEQVDKLSPQDSRLPATIALKGAIEVARRILPMDLFLLDAVSGSEYVLGDTPVPASNLLSGFATPLTSRLAFAALPPRAANLLRIRGQADANNVAQVNQDQVQRATAVIVGCSKAVLSAL